MDGFSKRMSIHGVVFSGGDRTFRNPNGLAGAARREFFLDEAVDHEAVVLPIDVEIEAERKKVVMVDAEGVLGNKLAVGFRGAVSVLSASVFSGSR